MKRLFALMLAVTVCLSVVDVAMAEDGQPGICLHSFVETRSFMGVKTMDGTNHYEIWSIDKVECTKCGNAPKGFTPHMEKKLKPHFSKDHQIYHYHSGEYHYFYKVCVCGVPMNQRKARCPGGDKHIGLMGLPPVVLEIK